MIKKLAASAFALAVSALLLPVEPSIASPATPKSAIVRQEARWLDALMKGDRATIASILAPGYKHVTSSGALLERNQELATASAPTPPMKWSEQTITLVGDTAIVHGLNTMIESGKTVRERFTDVFIDKSGTWLAIAAQETTVAK